MKQDKSRISSLEHELEISVLAAKEKELEIRKEKESEIRREKSKNEGYQEQLILANKERDDARRKLTAAESNLKEIKVI
jgi:hypothetical protein